MQKLPVIVIGSGLAGSECAWQLLNQDVPVVLIEMRPEKMTPAHQSAKPAELVCSNSFRSNDVSNAVGLLKEEMAILNSLMMRSAYQARVPAGGALAVDRDAFSDCIERALNRFDSLLTKVSGEVIGIESTDNHLHKVFLESGERYESQHIVIATGPLTSDRLSQWVASQTGQEHLYFYDSIAPIVDVDSINMKVAFRASRYGKGEQSEGDYINCPMTEAQYKEFHNDITTAELAEVHDFDKAQFFEGCLPIEVMAGRGEDTLRYGPMKPVGLTNPHKPDEKAYAVVQLRQDNLHATLFNMVGFQTRMKWGEQKRIFKKIPGLEKAEFHRMGAMHRNTYLCSPKVLDKILELKSKPGIHFAGQISGCEGYVESSAVGLFVGRALSAIWKGESVLNFPPATTALGALLRHILHADPDDYQPMNINFGLFEDLPEGTLKKNKKSTYLNRAVKDFRSWYYATIDKLDLT